MARKGRLRTTWSVKGYDDMQAEMYKYLEKDYRTWLKTLPEEEAVAWVLAGKGMQEWFAKQLEGLLRTAFRVKDTEKQGG